MKSEYNAFLAKSKQSDFTNSPTFAAKQLEMLEQLEALALKENLNEELEDIQQKKAELQEKYLATGRIRAALCRQCHNEEAGQLRYQDDR